jgi:hypothetical protein
MDCPPLVVTIVRTREIQRIRRKLKQTRRKTTGNRKEMQKIKKKSHRNRDKRKTGK